MVCGEVMSCDSCGRECTAACGTRQFRACCFNYLRKRGGAPTAADGVNDLDPGLRLELWLARGGVLPSQNFIHSPRSNVLGDAHHKQVNLDNEDYRDERIRSDQI